MGVLTAPHGVRGALRLRPETDFPERLSGRSVWIAGPTPRQVTIESVQPYRRGLLIVRLGGVNDRSAAESLRGCALEVAAEELPPLPEGTYYHHQIVGLRVRDLAGSELGRVVDIERTGANDVYVVERESGRRWYLPAIREVVCVIDVERGEMTIRRLDGLLEDAD